MMGITDSSVDNVGSEAKGKSGLIRTRVTSPPCACQVRVSRSDSIRQVATFNPQPISKMHTFKGGGGGGLLLLLLLLGTESDVGR